MKSEQVLGRYISVVLVCIVGVFCSLPVPGSHPSPLFIGYPAGARIHRSGKHPVPSHSRDVRADAAFPATAPLTVARATAAVP